MMIRRIRAVWLAIGLTCASAEVTAQTVDIADRRGVQEIVLIVKNLEAASKVYTDVGKFVVKADIAADPELTLLWQLPNEARLVQRVLGLPSTDRGFLRLVQIDGVEQIQIRSSARPFDTGGMFNFNTLVKDMDGVFEALRDYGFQGFADPNSYTIFGKRYAGAMLRGHDGVVINLLHRVDDPYNDLPAFETMSHIVNATQMVDDYQESFDFFTATLGWDLRWEAAPEWPEDGSNNMGLPNSILKAGSVKERAASFRFAPDADGGTIEIFHFDGVTGRDYADRAHPPNRGVLSYRIHVPGLASYLGQIAGRGANILIPLTRLEVAPYGQVDYAVVRAPSGAWLEFFDQTAGQ